MSGVTCTSTTRRTVEEVSAVSPEEDGIQKPAETDEGIGDDDEEAKGLCVRDGHHHRKLEDVHQLVEGALDTVDHAPLPFHHSF